MRDDPSSKQRSRRPQRLLSHLLLFAISVGTAVGLYLGLAIPYPSESLWIFRWSLASAYVAGALLAITLSIGVWNLLRRGSSPVSIDLRRDVGIWCGIFAVVHTLVGLNVHMKNWTQYFVDDSGGPRTDLFGLANYLGSFALVVVVVLLATSNDRSLALLKNRTWKLIQRWNYVFAAITAVHAALYIVVEKRFVPYLFILTGLIVWILLVQLVGVLKKRTTAKSTLKAGVGAAE